MEEIVGKDVFYAVRSEAERKPHHHSGLFIKSINSA
jgi:hypothetical protein